ncbi:MAG: DUF3368 domain-containing protein [Bacteroidetes bacterium]|nr:DUF3368 domain-containing protein [Bacteroidota bacterium]
MIVISDTSPLSNLFIIGRLDILKQMYDRLIVPEAVMAELLVLEQRGIDLTEIRTADWIEVKTITDAAAVNTLLADLDKGEAEAIVLAEELHAQWLLMDETKGRSIARAHGLRIIGLLGILLAAKQRGIVVSVRELIDTLISQAKFRVSEELYIKVISSAGE